MGIDLQDTFKQALSLHQQGQLDQARQAYQTVIAGDPNHANSLHFLGVLSYQENKFQEALDFINQAIAINPNNAGFYSNMGVVFMAIKDYKKAAQHYQKAITLDENNPDYYYNCANAQKKLKDVESARLNYDKAISRNPNNPDYHHNLGDLCKESYALEEAITHYQHAIALAPNYDSFLNCAIVLSILKKVDEAISYCHKALELNPASADAYFYLGNIVFGQLRDFALSIHYYEKALAIDPDYPLLKGSLMFSRNSICDWDRYEQDRQEIYDDIMADKLVISPFQSLALFDSSKTNYLVTKQYTKTRLLANSTLGPLPVYPKQDKIRIGYYSADFHNHATAYLMADMFECHDRSQFDIIAFSFGPILHDEMQQRVSQSFNQFIDVSTMSDEEVAKMSRELKIDIAIDLKGFTQDMRLGIFAYRCAPIQVNYLGYPGSITTDYMDYIIADKVILPVEEQAYYAEKILHMPHCYQANDSKKVIANHRFSREELGLPRDAFVFCSFNKQYKLSPEIFTIWMNILTSVPKSVLWLFEGNAQANANLKKEAKQRGVDPSRIIFAKNMPVDLHLARQQCADLFLDNMPYNAHTTCSDALWVGLPVLTLLGNSFASRVSASLLTAIDLPDMIMDNLDAYQKKAIDLAQNPTALQTIKDRLTHNRSTTPLFDSKSFTKDIESIYREIYDRYHRDQSKT